MTALIFDASAALDMVLPDESGDPAGRLALRLSRGECYAPSIWPTEVLNGIVWAADRQRIDAPAIQAILTAVESFAIDLDPTPEPSAWSHLIDLAVERDLSVYDSSYLELAIRHGCTLATCDKKLGRAAESLGVPLWDVFA